VSLAPEIVGVRLTVAAHAHELVLALAPAGSAHSAEAAYGTLVKGD